MLQRVNKYNGFLVRLVVLVMCLLLIVKPSYVEASDHGWDAAFSSIEQLHDSFTSMESVNKQDKQQIQMLRKQNNEKLKEINTQIQLIDKVKLDKLKSETDQVQKKYAPLLSQYTDLGKKATEARKRKNQKSALLLDLKRNRIKASAHAARQEIKKKKDALTAAKKQATAKAKIVKDTLAPVQTIKKQITSENKKISDINQNKMAANKQYKAAVKQGDAVKAAVELKLIIANLNQIHASQKKIYDWEENIRKIIYAAEARLPR